MSKELVYRLCGRAVLFAGVFLFSHIAQAQDALHYFKNYFVTGDYVVAGVGLRGSASTTTTSPTGKTICCFQTGNIVIGDNALPAMSGGQLTDIVAAFLYWQTDEPA